MSKRILFVIVAAALAAIFAAPGLLAQEGVVKYTRWAGTQEAVDFQKLIDTFSKSHPKVKVEYEFLPWNGYWEKVRTTVMSGEAADVLSMANSQAGAYLTKGAFMPMDDFPGAKAVFNQMQPGAQGSVLVNGKIMAMPVGVGVRAMIYNKALLDKAGVKYPDPAKPMTWDQFFAIAKKLTVKDGDKFLQYTARFHILEMYEGLIVGYGGKLMDSYTHPTKIMVNTPEGIKGLALAQRLFTENVMQPYTGEWQTEYGTPDTAVATGKIAFMQTGPWGLGPLNEAKINYGTCPIPVVKNRATRGYYNSLAIYRSAKNPKGAWELVKWLAEAEGQLEFAKTGDLPANKNALARAQKAGANADIMKAYYSELPYVIVGPMLPTSEWDGMLNTALTDLFQLRATPEQTAAKIEAEGNSIIASLFE